MICISYKEFQHQISLYLVQLRDLIYEDLAADSGVFAAADSWVYAPKLASSIHTFKLTAANRWIKWIILGDLAAGPATREWWAWPCLMFDVSDPLVVHVLPPTQDFYVL